MAEPLTTKNKRDELGAYDGATVGVLLVDADGADAASTSMVNVDEVTAHELSGDDGYVRTVLDVVVVYDGETGMLKADPIGTPASFDTTATTPAGAWLFDTAGGSDATDELLVFLPVEPGAGFADWEPGWPTNGLARWRVDVTESAGGSAPVDAELYDFTGLTPGVIEWDLSTLPIGKAGALAFAPIGDNTVQLTGLPDPATRGHVDLWILQGDGSFVIEHPLNSAITYPGVVLTVDGTLGWSGALTNIPAIESDASMSLVSYMPLDGTNTGGATTTTEGALIHGATGKTTPVDADELGLVDSAASNILKKLTWANLKAAVKAYADTLYDAIGAAAAAVAAHVGDTDPHGDRAYAAGLFAANDALVYKGAIDCSANPNYPAADAGHAYKVSVAGKIGGGSGPNVEVGDLLVCTVDSSASGNHGTVGANWDIIQVNLDGAVIGPTSAVSGKVATFSGTSGRLIQDSGVTLGGAASLNVGTTAGTVAAGDDSRLTDTRTPTDNSVTSAKIVDGTITTADLADMANKTYRGRHTAGSGVPEDVSVANVMADLSGAAAADFSLNSHKLTNVATPTASADAATKGYVDLRDLSVTATKTANYTAASGEYVPVDTTSGVIVITLPTAPADGTVVAVKRVAGTTNAVTVNTAGSDVFNVSGGVTTGSLSVLNQAFEMIYRATGAIWVVNTSLALSQLDVRFAPATLVSSDQSGTTYTTVLADANTLVRLTNASLVTVTIPTNASVAYPLNTILTLHARGAAGGTLAAAGGVTIRNNSTATFAQYAEISVRKDGTDEWIRVG